MERIGRYNTCSWDSRVLATSQRKVYGINCQPDFREGVDIEERSAKKVQLIKHNMERVSMKDIE